MNISFCRMRLLCCSHTHCCLILTHVSLFIRSVGRGPDTTLRGFITQAARLHGVGSGSGQRVVTRPVFLRPVVIRGVGQPDLCAACHLSYPRCIPFACPTQPACMLAAIYRSQDVYVTLQTNSSFGWYQMNLPAHSQVIRYFPQTVSCIRVTGKYSATKTRSRYVSYIQSSLSISNQGVESPKAKRRCDAATLFFRHGLTLSVVWRQKRHSRGHILDMNFKLCICSAYRPSIFMSLRGMVRPVFWFSNNNGDGERRW